MWQARLIKILMVWIVVTVSAGAQDQLPRPKYKALRLPHGKHFPASERFLLQLRDTPGEPAKAKLRKHAWDLFQGLTRGSPIWDTWYTKCDVGLKNCGEKFLQDKPNLHKPLRNFEVPIQSLEQVLESGASFNAQSPFSLESFQQVVEALAIRARAHPEFASVIFNQQAADHVRSQCLANGSGSTRTAPCSTLPVSGKIKEFQRGAVVLKTFWELVVNEKGIGRLSTWKQELWNRIQQANDHDITRFHNISALKIDLSSTSPTTCENRDYRDGEIVPLSCFYAIQVSQDDVDALRASPQGLVAISDMGILPGDYLVLVALHVTTKEIPEWAWATFWWDNHGASDARAAGRPKNVKPQWSHFLMETTLSGTTPLETDGGPKICFNPYLETSLPNGAISNCLQCHSKAAYGQPSQVGAYDLGILGRDGKTLASGNQPDPHYFDNRVQTDFIWSIANARGSNIQSLENLFQKDLHDLQLQQLRLDQEKNTVPPKK